VRQTSSIFRLTQSFACLALAATLALAACAGAARAAVVDETQSRQFEEGLALYQNGGFAGALARVEPLAEAGMADAQFLLGTMAMAGAGLDKDEAEAARWFQLAADQGHVGAQNMYGLMLYEGRGVARDFQRSFLYFELAAIAGNQEAAANRLIVAKKLDSQQMEDMQKKAGAMIEQIQTKVAPLVALRYGSGVALAPVGYILTHVKAVQGCDDLRLQFGGVNVAARVIATDPFNGFALLAPQPELSLRGVRLRLDSPALDEIMHVEAYVLDDHGAIVSDRRQTTLLSSPMLQRPDRRYFDLGFASRTGHLGAPVIDASGAVVGVVETDLDPASLAQMIGPPPKELTFALHARLAALLLQINGFAVETVTGSAADGAPTATDDATVQAVVGVECWALSEASNDPPSRQRRAEPRDGSGDGADRAGPEAPPVAADAESDSPAATRP